MNPAFDWSRPLVALKPLVRLVAVAASLGAAMAAPHPAIPAPGGLDGLGVNIHFTDARPGELEMMAAAGFKWVRMDLGWEGIEKSRGVYDFAAYDRLLAALDAHHMRAVLILDYSHRLYEKVHAVVTPAGREAYAKWAAATVSHFAGRGVLWEMWNEPNIENFWKPRPDAAAYAEMALAAAKAIRAAAPHEAMIGPGCSGIDLKFIETCCQAGLLAYWDAVSVHPYRQEGPETAAGDYGKLRALIAKHTPPGRSIPIISGEWGYSAGWEHFEPVKQGQMLPREWLVNLAQGIPISIWYDWHDDGTDAKEPEHHFGTVEHAYQAGGTPIYQPKPAYLAAKTLTTTLAGCHFVKRLAVGDPRNYALLFAKEGGWVLAMWTSAPTPGEVKIPSSAGIWTLTGHTGETLQLVQALSGAVAVTLQNAPCYLKGQGGNPTMFEAPAELSVNVAVQPTLGGIMEIRLENLGNIAISGTATLTDLKGLEMATSKVPFTLAADAVECSLQFPLKSMPDGPYQAGVTLEAEGRVLLQRPPRRFSSLPADPFIHSRLWADGDAKVPSSQTLETATVPLDPPRTGSPAMVKISYQMDAGWKFIQASPPANANAAIPGRPTAIGCWINSPTASGLSPRLRVKDATGQVWQPTGDTITWTGWRYVEFPLDPTRCGHWGGRNDGVMHYPLSWESFILLDNVQRTKTAGSVTLTVPVVIEPAGQD